MGRWVRLSGLLLAMGVFLVSCNRSGTTPTPGPLTPVLPIATSANDPGVNAPVDTLTHTVAAPPASTLEAEASPPSPTSIVSQGAVFTSPRYSYTIMLPCCWLALPTPGTAIESALAEMEDGDGPPVFGDLTDRLREQKTGAVLELIALLPDDKNAATPVAQMTVSVLPTHGLTLDGYLAATEAELNSIANTSVLTAQIEPTLGVEGLPAVVIEYTAGNVAVSPTPLATPAVDGDADSGDADSGDVDSGDVVAGLQVAFFGESPDYLIVLTFTATTEQYAELQAEFLHIVRTITLGDPAV